MTDDPAPSSLRTLRRCVAGAVVLAFLIALKSPTLLLEHQRQWSEGWTLLLVGLMGPFEGQFGWCANLAMAWTVVVLLLGRRPPLIVCLVGAALAVSTRFTLHEISSDVRQQVLAFGPGYYLWAGCSLALLVHAAADRAMAARPDGPGAP